METLIQYLYKETIANLLKTVARPRKVYFSKLKVLR